MQSFTRSRFAALFIVSCAAPFALASSVVSVANAQVPSTPPSASASPAVFARLNGEVIPQDEFTRQLERLQVGGNGPGQNALRVTLDQLIGSRVFLAEAQKQGVVPSDEAVNRYLQTQKDLYEHQYPGKKYEDNLRDQGISVDDIKGDLKAQLAETNLYIKRMNLNQNDIRDLYDKVRGQVGIPERAQVRLVVVAANSEELKQAEKLFAAKTDFAEVAKQANPPALRANGGLFGPLAPVQSLNLPPVLREAIEKNAEGQVIGPVDLPNNGPALKGWMKIEKKLPGYKLPFESAAVMVARQLVQQKLAEPANAKHREEMVAMKLNSKFEPTNPRYLTVWEAIKRDAKPAPTGQTPTTSAPN